MSYQDTVERIQHELIATFNQLDVLFELPAVLRQYQPATNEWSIDEILEHVTLTNHFLMITLKQSLKKVLRRAQNQSIPADETQLDRIIEIGDPDAFGWIRPEHMEPTRNITSQEVRQRMKSQMAEALDILSQIRQGEGALHKVRMSVQDLGKLNMYEWLYFLVQHAKRHLVEMKRIVEIHK